MNYTAIEKEITADVAWQTISQIFGRSIHRGKIIIMTDESLEVEPYPEDHITYTQQDVEEGVDLHDYMKQRWLIA